MDYWSFFFCICCIKNVALHSILEACIFKESSANIQLWRLSSCSNCQDFMSLMGLQMCRTCGCQWLQWAYCEPRSAACCNAAPYVCSWLQIRGRQRGPPCCRRRRRGDKCQRAAYASSPQWDDNHDNNADWCHCRRVKSADPCWGDTWVSTMRTDGYHNSNDVWERGLICVWWTVVERTFISIRRRKRY